MKKLFLFLIIFFSFCFVKVKGVTTDNYITINNTRMYGTNTIYTAGGNQSVKIVRNGSVDKAVPLYGFVAICSALGSDTDHYITQWSSQLADEMNIINSTDGCYLPDTTYYRETSRIIYITFRLPMTAYDCGSGSGVCQLTSDIDLNFTQPNSNVYSLINFGLGSEAFTFPDAINVQVNQNQQIINGQQNIINNQNTNSQNEINNATQNKNDIINNQNTTTNTIINNQDSNTNKIIEDNKNNFNTCYENLFFSGDTTSSNGITFTKNNDYSYNISGTTSATANLYNYKSLADSHLSNNETYTLYTNISLPNGVSILVEGYNDNTWVRHILPALTSSNDKSTLQINLNGINRIRYGIRVDNGRSVDISNLKIMLIKNNSSLGFSQPGEEYCFNKMDNISDLLDDSNVDSPNNALSGLNSYLATNSTISNLITLPISLFQKVLSSLNGTCSNYDLGEYKGTHIILPCINISNYIGATLFNVIDVLISGLLIYKMSRKFIAVFHNLSSMKEGDVISD